MGDVVTRKCACCKDVIVIDRNNISNVLQFQDKYYHSDCFEAMATEKAASKRGKPQMWQDALDHIWELEAETKKMLEHFWAKDDLNEWLLENYDVTMVPNRFWQIVAELEGGMYKRKRCKPVSIDTLYHMWKWAQKRLNKIDAKNKERRMGPQTDDDRIRYDLSIILSHTEDFKKYQRRIEAEKAESEAENKKNNKSINYGSISKSKEDSKKYKEDNINDILDEIFG